MVLPMCKSAIFRIIGGQGLPSVEAPELVFFTTDTLTR